MVKREGEKEEAVAGREESVCGETESSPRGIQAHKGSKHTADRETAGEREGITESKLALLSVNSYFFAH